MSYNIGKKDIIWSYTAYLFKYGTNLFILPLILGCLTSDEIGMWYTFTSVGAFVLLFDLGFSPTIMRNFSYAWSGAKKLSKKGFNEVSSSEPNYSLLFEVMDTARVIYLIISSIALIVILGGGTFYISSLISNNMDTNKTMIAWFLYSIGIFFNLYYSYWNPLLMGIGKIKEYQKAVVFSQLMFLSITFLGFYFKLGLISIAMGYLINGLTLRVLCKIYYKKSNINFYYKKTCYKNIIKNIKVMWHNAYRSALVSLGVYLETNINTIIASKLLGLSDTGSYGLMLQIFLVIRTFSSTAIRTYLPSYNNLRVVGRMDELRIKVSKNIVISWITYLFIILAFILFGRNLLSIIGKEAILPNNLFIIIFSIQAFLVFNHGDIFSPIITTRNEIPFVIPTLCTGISIGILSYIFVKYFNMGIWGLLMSSLISELAYNNWKWPIVVMKDLNISLFYIIRLGFNSIANQIIKKKVKG